MARSKASRRKKGLRIEKPVTSPERKPRRGKREPPIVGIGASAGGLEALEGFFRHMPSNSGMAFVVIQHLSPQHVSAMDTLLTRYTEMQVLNIEDGIRVKPNHIYLNPPDKHVVIMNGKLCLMEPKEPHGVKMPINYFLRSLAEDRGEKAICIILSGTGSDGALGLKAVKGEGGLAIAQNEKQAKFDGMPRSAIDTGLVDLVLPVERMGDELMKYSQHPYVEGGQVRTDKKSLGDYMRKIFFLIRSKAGHDFSNYKQNTILRRTERRMALHHINQISEYVHYLEQKPDEIIALHKDMLITVTNFFRDAGAFEILERKVLPELLKSKPDEGAVRVWVAGCGTGEEAYSIAILLAETMAKLKKQLEVQVFATDLDSEGIEHARIGVYPESIAADISAERLLRFFVKEDTGYKVKKQIREMVVFAAHDLIKDPPFSKLDLVTCRNVLIYMDALLQRKILRLFDYTLNPKGVLFLGTSETIGGLTERFEPIDAKWRIFRHKGTVPKARMVHSLAVFNNFKDEGQDTRGVDIKKFAERTILQSYAPPCVLVDKKYNVVYFNGRTEMYLSPPVGEPTFNVLKMARDELRYTLSTMLHKAGTQKKTVVCEGVKIKHNNGILTINLVVRPITEPAAMSGLLMVVFESKKPLGKLSRKKEKKTVGSNDVKPREEALEQELQSTKECLQTTIEEMETSNEELQSTNEELQSTNEELETSREELQSTNEELQTMNSELQEKVEELSNANNDLNNLLGSTEIGTIFLDNGLRIKRFTPATGVFFKIISSDVGRPISDIAHNLGYDGFLEDIKQVINNLGQIDRELQTREGKSYIMRILPYRTVENVVDGVVITFLDITAQKKSQERESAAKAAQVYTQAILDTVREPLVVLDENLRVVSANRSFYETFEVNRENTEQKLIYELGDGQWDIPRLRELLEQILPEDKQFEGLEVTHDFLGIGRRVMLLNGRHILQENQDKQRILLAIEDITHRHEKKLT
ncbi:MAG: chemotaxis protein CheB [Phycisphaerae bacterium]|nr:chemotaxis protein CheB [Phycisphaerae bacterium]MDD5381302.1 chemotaxis protein CheB [Phycisphaerae bacterium]